MKHTLLVIEDDADIREVIGNAIAQFMPDAVLHLAKDGIEGIIHLLQGVRPCLIFLDLHMPGLDGNGFLRIKNNLPDVIGTPVAVLTATRNEKIEPDHVVSTIEKPTELVTLLNTLEAHCGAE